MPRYVSLQTVPHIRFYVALFVLTRGPSEHRVDVSTKSPRQGMIGSETVESHRAALHPHLEGSYTIVIPNNRF